MYQEVSRANLTKHKTFALTLMHRCSEKKVKHKRTTKTKKAPKETETEPLHEPKVTESVSKVESISKVSATVSVSRVELSSAPSVKPSRGPKGKVDGEGGGSGGPAGGCGEGHNEECGTSLDIALPKPDAPGLCTCYCTKGAEIKEERPDAHGFCPVPNDGIRINLAVIHSQLPEIGLEDDDTFTLGSTIGALDNRDIQDDQKKSKTQSEEHDQDDQDDQDNKDGPGFIGNGTDPDNLASKSATVCSKSYKGPNYTEWHQDPANGNGYPYFAKQIEPGINVFDFKLLSGGGPNPPTSANPSDKYHGELLRASHTLKTLTIVVPSGACL